MSSSRVLIFDRSGRQVGMLQTSTTRSWVLNGEGQCTFPLALTDAKAAVKLLQYGNLIYIEHATLPAWAGVLDTPRDWGGDGTLTITAWTGERLLKFRRSPILDNPLTATSAGALFQKMIDFANAAEDMLIKPGDQWKGGTPREEALDGKDLYTHVTQISGRTANDWSIDGIRDDNGKLYFLANWWQQRGVTCALDLKEGRNIERGDKPLAEQGTIVNDLLGVGDGSTAATRLTYSQIDPASHDSYGLRQDSEDFSGNSDAATLQANVRGRLTQTAQPLRTFGLVALDQGDTFKNLRLGNRMALHMQTVGFLADGRFGVDTTVRIRGMRYDDASEKVELTADERSI